MMRPRLPLLLLSLATVLGGATLVAGCGSSDDQQNPDGPFEVDNGFESDDPTGRSAQSKGGEMNAGGTSSSSGSSGTSGSVPAPADPSGADASRAIEEADIIKQEGNRLYALSRYGGLAVVDITDPDHMKLLGRKRTEGMPFEMYVRNGRAYVMLNDFGRYIYDAYSVYGRWVQTSEILALDVQNPANISEVTHYDVPGEIADSRVVGDALYLVTFENGYCWGCGQKPSTIVTSFNVAGTSIAKVDALAFTSPNKDYSAWQRSVSATNERLYIAGPEWTWSPGATNASSVIQVVDITDPGGKLKKGADVSIAGQINSRWQMDEFNGVLRVVSQHGTGWGNSGINPKVETFTIASSNNITPLGSTELIIPKPEQLRSVRFDGPRAYAITAERKDPLFTIDVSNPAAPAQKGELSMPGWIFYMEPRGDRLVGFGYDDTVASNAKVAVSLFDVTDLAKPSMLKRVTFGEGWSQLAEDQDRIHKSVRVLDDQNLVLVPFASYGRWDGAACSKPQSGIQLIDYTHDNLVLRGIAPQYGMPRRALVANNRLLGVSDRNVSSFDIANRDTPVKKQDLDLSNPAYRMVELPAHIASITNDWWTGEVTLSLTPKANADDAAITGKLSLASLAEQDAAKCTSGASAWASWYQARLFTQGNFVYVTVPVYTYDSSVRGGKVVVAAVDVSNPLAPVIASKTEMKLTTHDTSTGYYGWYGYGFYDGYEYYSYYGGMNGSLVGSGQAIVQQGTKLAYIEIDNDPIEIDLGAGRKRYDSRVHRKIHVADFANAAAPVVHAPIDLGDSFGGTPLHVLDGVVMTSKWVRSTKNPDKVRFFMDRVDINGASPVRLASINTPGSLLLVDQEAHRLVTTDYSALRTSAPDWQACQTSLGWRAYWDYDTHDCMLVSRSFKLADIAGTKVTLRQTFVPPSQNISGVQIADDRIYITRYARYDYSSVSSGPGTYASQPKVIEDGGLWAIGGIRAGTLSIVSQSIGDADWPLAAFGTKVALYTQGGIAIYDTSTPTPTKVIEQNLRGYGYSSHVLMGPNRAIASLGEWGLQTINY